MKLLIINSVCGIRSTGRIATDIALEYEKKGYEVKIAYGRETVPEDFKKFAVRIGNEFNVKLNALSCRLFDNDGFAAKAQTKKFLKWAEEFNPDELWLHNLHGYYINVELLFNWIKSRPQMKVKWTLHDCWAFTGHCTHFSYRGCYKWKKECERCPAKNEYPKSIFISRCQKNYIQKKECLLSVENMTLITPSNWLANLVKNSFLRDYPVIVKHNTIDLDVFKPTPSDFRKKYNLEDKKIILGVASQWTPNKGIHDFYKLALVLPKDYVIVMVGLSAKQIKKAPKEIIKIAKTNLERELAELYTAADVLLNPSKEETYGLTIAEAGACGTPSIVLKNTACEETIREYKGLVVEDSIDAMKSAIIKVIGGGY